MVTHGVDFGMRLFKNIALPCMCILLIYSIMQLIYFPYTTAEFYLRWVHCNLRKRILTFYRPLHIIHLREVNQKKKIRQVEVDINTNDINNVSLDVYLNNIFIVNQIIWVYMFQKLQKRFRAIVENYLSYFYFIKVSFVYKIWITKHSLQSL